MRVERVLETCLYADDLEAAESFYSRVLGLRRLSREQNRHVFFRCGPNMLLIFNPEQTLNFPSTVPGHGALGPGHVAFAVPEEELDSWRRHLSELEITVEQEVAWPGGGRSIYFRDPYGNSVELATASLWGEGSDAD
jgi:catechol 2,3-dioxygenase-like lactoylglutathione lyase family enzyme